MHLPIESGSMILFTRISYSSLVVEHLDFGPDHMVNFSLGWNFALPTGLKYCCDYMLNFSLRPERKFPRENLLRCRNTIDTHVRAPFWARGWKNDGESRDCSARLPGLKILETGLKPPPCNRRSFQEDFFQNPIWNLSPANLAEIPME